MRSKLVQVDNPEPEVPKKILAQEILAISSSLKKLLASGLTERAIICLIQDHCELWGCGGWSEQFE